MTHNDLIGLWAKFLADDGADYAILVGGEEPCILIPADDAILFASIKPLTTKQRKAYGHRGADMCAKRVVIVEGPPAKCVKTLVHVKGGAK